MTVDPDPAHDETLALDRTDQWRSPLLDLQPPPPKPEGPPSRRHLGPLVALAAVFGLAAGALGVWAAMNPWDGQTVATTDTPPELAVVDATTTTAAPASTVRSTPTSRARPPATTARPRTTGRPATTRAPAKPPATAPARPKSTAPATTAAPLVTIPGTLDQ